MYRMEKKTVKQMYLYCTIYLTPFGMWCYPANCISAFCFLESRMMKLAELFPNLTLLLCFVNAAWLFLLHLLKNKIGH